MFLTITEFFFGLVAVFAISYLLTWLIEKIFNTTFKI